MRLLRFLLLVAVIAVAYGAQFLLDQRNLAAALPEWMLAQFPALVRFTHWLPQDLLNLGLWLLVMAGLVFGLLAPMWHGELVKRSSTESAIAPSVPNLKEILLWFAVAVAPVLSGFAAWATLDGTGSVLLTGLAWAAGIAILLATGAGLSALRRQPAARKGSGIHPAATWPIFLLVLLTTTAVYIERLPAVPARIDTYSALFGLQVHAFLHGQGASLFAPGRTYVPGLAYWPAIALTWLTRDGLWGIRLAGVYGGLLTVTATWLLGCEVFRRVPLPGRFGEPLEDDGRRMALLATLAAAPMVALLNFSRAPGFVEVTGWGALGAWSLLRGMRTGNFFWAGLGGVLMGIAICIGPSGLVFVAAATLWWVGGWLLARSEAHAPAHQPVWVGVHWGSGIFWLVGLCATLLPWAAVCVSMPTLAQHYLAGATAVLQSTAGTGGVDLPPAMNLGTRFYQTLLAFNLYPDRSGVFGYNGPLLNSLVAPLLILATGALLFNLDTMAGWVILTWLGSGLLLGGLLAPSAPAWTILLPLIPAVALAITYAMDRIRVLLMQTLGTWTMLATIYLALGVLAGAGLLSWIQFYDYVQMEGDLGSYVGRAARDADEERPVVLVTGNPAIAQVTEDPVVQFLTSAGASPLDVTSAAPGQWPDVGAHGLRLVLAPEEAGRMADIQAQYPSGRLEIVRNLRGDPMLYIYDVAGSESKAGIWGVYCRLGA